MILSDHEIQAAIELGLLLIEPRPDLSLYSSTALDLTLDSVVLRWNDPDPSAPGPVQELRPAAAGFDLKRIMDDPSTTTRVAIGPQGFPLTPRAFILGFTQQRIICPTARGWRPESKGRAVSLGWASGST